MAMTGYSSCRMYAEQHTELAADWLFAPAGGERGQSVLCGMEPMRTTWAEILTEVSVEICWDIKPSSSVKANQHIRGTCWLHLQA
jgi:hypothetical protein